MIAIHIGADSLKHPPRSQWPPARSAADTVARLSRLASAAGVAEQTTLLGADASMSRVIAAIASATARLSAGGVLLLSFSGHSERARDEPRDTGWCLYDGTLWSEQVNGLLQSAPPTASVFVIVESCHAGALARTADVDCGLVLFAACAEEQMTLNCPVSEFVLHLEDLVFPGGTRNPECTSYEWLNEQLQRDTPDVERPFIWCNDDRIRHRRPFAFC